MLKKLILTLAAASFGAAAAPAANEIINPVMRLNDKARIDVYNRETGIAGQFDSRRFVGTDDWVKIDFSDVSDLDANVIDRAAPAPLLRAGRFREPKTGVFCNYTFAVKPAGENAAKLHITVTPESPEKLRELFWSVRTNAPFLGREIRMTIRNGQVRYRDQKVIPAEQNGGWVWNSPAGHAVEQVDIPLRFGTLRLSGFSTGAMICKYGDRTGNLRLALPVRDGRVDAELDIAFLPYTATPLDLSAAANMGFADPVENDRQGGWTDQGPDNDFAIMPLGLQTFGNVPVRVLDPAENGGKSVLAFRNPARPEFLKEAVIPADGGKYAWLYLFHAAAWCNRKAAGSIEVAYADGTASNFEVIDRRDVGNWWEPAGAVNAAVVFQGQNPSSVIGMYLSRFRLERKPVRSVKLTSADNSVWLVAGASLVPDEGIPFPAVEDNQERPLTLNPRNYREFTFDKNPVRGSALDFSWLLDAPAGKYGRAVINGEHFEFERRPGRPVRFLGVSICEESNMLEHADSIKLAGRIAACGYNAVRFHHFDGFLVKPDATRPEIDPAMLDRMHFLFAELKKRGIYLTLDLYTMRTGGFSRPFKGMFEVKTQMMFDPELRKNLVEFARNLLLPVNPYTGMSMNDDPALVSIGIINENPLLLHHDEYKYPNRNPVQQANMTRTYRAWCEKNGLTPQERPPAQEWLRFLLDQQSAVFDEMKSALRGIGVKAPFSDLSCTSMYPSALPRSRYDYVDNHTYFDHPTFPGDMFRMPFQNHNRSVIASGFPVPLQAGAARIFGKPFMLTEFNFCVPNDKRSEGGPVMGALAAMQDWSGIFRFEFGTYQRSWKIDPTGNGGQLGAFATANDPILQLSDRITALFYLRGDVKPLSTERTLTVTPQVYRIPQAADYANWFRRQNADIPENFTKLGLLHRIGMRVADRIPAGSFDVETLLKGETLVDLTKPVASPAGEFTANCPNGTLQVVTPRSEALVIPSGGSLKGGLLAANGSEVFSTVFAGALDDKTLADSRRVLILHLTDVKAAGQRLAMLGSRILMYNLGRPSPYLMRRGKVEIELVNRAPGTAVLRALDVNGKTLGDVPFTEKAGKIVFSADPGVTGAFAYELLRR